MSQELSFSEQGHFLDLLCEEPDSLLRKNLESLYLDKEGMQKMLNFSAKVVDIFRDELSIKSNDLKQARKDIRILAVALKQCAAVYCQMLRKETHKQRNDKIRLFRETRVLFLEKVDMVASLGVMQQGPGEDDACPPAYCTMPLASAATARSASPSRGLR